jgi:hypothetical protein
MTQQEGDSAGHNNWIEENLEEVKIELEANKEDKDLDNESGN